MHHFGNGMLKGPVIPGILPAVRGQGTVSNGTAAATTTPANPASAVAGDLIIAMVATSGNRASTLTTVSAGWTFGGVISQGNVTIGWAWGYAGVVVGNCQFTWTTNTAFVSRTTAFLNVRAASPIGVTSSNSGTANNMNNFGWTPSTHGKSLQFLFSANQAAGQNTGVVAGFTNVSQNSSSAVSLNQMRQTAAVDPKGSAAADYTSSTSFGGLAWSIISIEICSVAVP